MRSNTIFLKQRTRRPEIEPETFQYEAGDAGRTNSPAKHDGMKECMGRDTAP